jgi:hypothetical protein
VVTGFLTSVFADRMGHFLEGSPLINRAKSVVGGTGIEKEHATLKALWHNGFGAMLSHKRLSVP